MAKTSLLVESDADVRTSGWLSHPLMDCEGIGVALVDSLDLVGDELAGVGVAGRGVAIADGAVGEGVVPILRQVPGFQEHFLVETSEGMLSISVFADQAGAEESTDRAAEWVQQNLADFFVGPPPTLSGSVWRHDVGEAVTGAPAP